MKLQLGDEGKIPFGSGYEIEHYYTMVISCIQWNSAAILMFSVSVDSWIVIIMFLGDYSFMALFSSKRDV